MFQDEQYELKNLDILFIQRLTINNQYKLLIGTIANTVCLFGNCFVRTKNCFV